MPRGDLTSLPLYGRELATCDTCELQKQCDRGSLAHSYRPKNFNGLMIVGEGPGQEEVARGRPFVGRSGKLLQAMLDQVGIDFEQCYVTNATLGKPPPHKKAFMKDFPNAVTSCLPRLEAEIAAVRPRIILGFGSVALAALTGYDVKKNKRVDVECSECNEHRKIGPVLQCAGHRLAEDGTNAEPCGALHFFEKGAPLSPEQVDPDELIEVRSHLCPTCLSTRKKLRPKMIKCLACGGRKSRTEEVFIFKCDYTINDVAGAVFTPAKEGEDRAQHNVGRWFGEQGVKYVINTWHPSFLLRDQQFHAEAVLKHLLRVKRLLTSEIRWKLNYKVTANPAVVRDFVFGWRLKGGQAPHFSIDIETLPRTEVVPPTIEGEDVTEVTLDARNPYEVGKIKCIGIGTPEAQLVVDTRDVDPNDPNDPLLDVLARFLTDDEIPKSYHNGATYDILVNDLCWGIPWDQQVTSYVDDTLAMHTQLYPDEPHKLSHVAFSYTDSPAWKPPRTAKGQEVHESFEELALYNARDVYNTACSRVAMHAELKTNKLSKVDEIDRAIRPIAVSMTMRGMPVSRERLNEVAARAAQQVKEAEDKTRRILEEARIKVPDNNYEAFNPHAPAQLVPVLFTGGFGLPVLETSQQTGVASTKESVIHALLGSTRDPQAINFLRALLDVREHKKIQSTYISALEPSPLDGHVHPRWKPWGTKTGRFTVSPNYQAFPKWLRIVIEAITGRKIVGSDYDQLELRASAAVSGDPVLIRKCLTADDKRKLEPDHDPHSFVAALAFGAVYTSLLLKDPNCIAKTAFVCKCQTCTRKALRDLVKRVIYGLNYGSGDAKVIEAIYSKGDYHGPAITLDMVARIRKSIFSTFTQIQPWREEILAEANRTYELRSPMHGRRRVFPLGEIPVTEAYNYPIQSFAADMVNEQTIELHRRLPDVDKTAYIMAQVHDAIYVYCDEDRAEKVSALMNEVLPRSIVLREGAPPMHFSASSCIADNWKDAA